MLWRFLEPSFHAWFGLTERPTMPGFLFAVLGSIGLGVFVSGIRWVVFEKLGFIKPKNNLDHSKRTRDRDTEVVFQNLVANHYQFYQFYSNVAVSLVLLFLAWVSTRPTESFWVQLVGGLLTIAILCLCAKNASDLYDEKAAKILGTTGKGAS